MDRNRGQYAGYSYPAARSKPSVAPASNSSIFGVISKVNKGILKNPIPQGQKPTSVQTNPSPSSSSSGRSALPPKPEYKQPEFSDKQKQDAFMLAKTRVEEIQKGLWKTSEKRKKSDTSSEPFKVPQLPARSGKPGQAGLSGQGHRDKGNLKDQEGQDSVQSKPTIPLVEYEDDDNDDQPKRSSSYNREKALEEIDRYRVGRAPGRGSGSREASETRGSYDKQTREFEREDHYNSAYRKDRYESRESDRNQDSKSQGSRYDEHYRLSADSRHRNADETKEDSKQYSSYEVFDYGHASDRDSKKDKGNEDALKSRRFEETKTESRKFEETKQADKDRKDTSVGDYSRRSYDASRSYEEEVRTRHPDSQYSSKNIDNYKEQYGERYQRDYQRDTSETKRSWDDGQTSGRYSGGYRSGYEDTGRQYGRDGRDSFTSYTRYDDYSDKGPSASRPYDSYSQDYETRSRSNLHDSDRMDYSDRREKFKEGSSDHGKSEAESSKDSGDMLYEDFLFGSSQDEKQVDKEEQFDHSKTMRGFEPDREKLNISKDSRRFDQDKEKFDTSKDSRRFNQDRQTFDVSKDSRRFDQGREKFDASKDSRGFNQDREKIDTSNDSRRFDQDREKFDTSKDSRHFDQDRGKFDTAKDSRRFDQDRGKFDTANDSRRFDQDRGKFDTSQDSRRFDQDRGKFDTANDSRRFDQDRGKFDTSNDYRRFDQGRERFDTSKDSRRFDQDRERFDASNVSRQIEQDRSQFGLKDFKGYEQNREKFDVSQDSRHFGQNRNTLETSKDYKQFGEEHQSRFADDGHGNDFADRSLQGKRKRVSRFGPKEDNQYGSNEDTLSSSRAGKPSFETRWANEKSETVAGGLMDRQRDRDDVHQGLEPVVAAVPGSNFGVAKAVLGPGILCKDCNIACLDTEVYEAHLKSDSHVLTLQKKAQELFQMTTVGRKSRFSPAEPLYPLPSDQPPAAPDKVVTVIPPKPKGPLQADSIGCESLNIGWSRLSDDEELMVEKYVVEYRNARETHWVTVGTTTKHEYIVDGLQELTDYLFRVFAVNGDEKSEILESVLITTRRRKDPSVRRPNRPSPERRRISPDRRRISPERRRQSPPRRRPSPLRRRPSPDRRRPSPEKRKTSTDRDKSGRESNRSSERDRDRKLSQEKDRDRGRTASKEKDKDERSSKSSGSGDRSKGGETRDDKKKRERERSGHGKPDEKASKEQTKSSAEKKDSDKDSRGRTTDDKGKKGDNKKTAVSDSKKKGKDEGRKKSEEKEEESMEVSGEGSGEAVEEVECLLYRELPNIEEQPLLGLEFLWEIVSYKPTVPVRYLCKLCNTKGFSSPVMLRHIIGFPHKMEFFKKYNMTTFDMISMIPARKEQIERLNYEGRLVEDTNGRGAVKVMIMMNPQDTDGKVRFKDPVEVKAPLPDRSKVTEPAPHATMMKSKFRAILKETVEFHELEDIALIGLSYMKEFLHPTDEKQQPRYTCSLCNVICTDKTIIFHMIGKKHRLAYLKIHFPDFWDLTTKSPEGKLMVIKKAKELEEKHGSGDFRCIVARTPKLWKHNVRSKEIDFGGDEEDEEGGVQEESKSTEAGPGAVQEAGQEAELEAGRQVKETKVVEEKEGVKFGIKKADPASKHVKPVNVLDQAKPKTKEAFDWNKENAVLQAKIQNQTIIKSARKSKFITVYAEFFKRYPVIGLQWVTEFQKPDPKMEPWYMCFLCQQKLQWKNILDHVTSSSHRINYMKKNFESKYQSLLATITTNKTRGRAVIETYSREIMQQENSVVAMEVMLELNINKEALKSVMKVKDHVKSTASATPAIAEKDHPRTLVQTSAISSISSELSTSTSVVSSSSSVGSIATTTTTLSVPLTQPPIVTGQPELPPMNQPPPVLPVAPYQVPVTVGSQPLQTQPVSYPQAASLPVQPIVYPPGTLAPPLHLPPPAVAMNNRFPPPMVNTTGMSTNQPQAYPPLNQTGPMSTGYSQNVYSSTGFTQQGTGSVLPMQQSIPPFRPSVAPPSVPYRPSLAPTNTTMAGQQQPWQARIAPNPVRYQPPVNTFMSQNAPLTGAQTGLQFDSQLGQFPNQQVPVQTGSGQGNNMQTVIEKQAEKVLTNQILQTGQFPSQGMKVSLADNSFDRNRPRIQPQGANFNQRDRHHESRFGQQEDDQFQRGEKRQTWTGRQTEEFDESKRARMEGNDWQNTDTRRRAGSRFDNQENKRSVSPHGRESLREIKEQYDRDRERGYSSGQTSRREHWSDRSTDSYRRSDEYDSNRGGNTRESSERFGAYRDQLTHEDMDKDIQRDLENENDFDLPLSSRELENLVQRYTDRTDEDYEGLGDFENEFEKARSQDEYFDDSNEDLGYRRGDRDIDDLNEDDSYRRQRLDDDWGSTSRDYRRSRFEPDDRTDRQELRRDSPSDRRGRDTYGDDSQRRDRGRQERDDDPFLDDRRHDRDRDSRQSNRSRGESRFGDTESRGREDWNRRDRLQDIRDRSPRSDSDRSGSDRPASSRFKNQERSRTDRILEDDLDSRSRQDRSPRESDRLSRSNESPQSDIETRSRPSRFHDDDFERRPRAGRLARNNPDFSRSDSPQQRRLQRRGALEREDRGPGRRDYLPDPSREEIDNLLRKVSSMVRMPEEIRQSALAGITRDTSRGMDPPEHMLGPDDPRDRLEPRFDRDPPEVTSGARFARGDFAGDSRFQGGEWTGDFHGNPGVVTGAQIGGTELSQELQGFSVARSDVGQQGLLDSDRELWGRGMEQRGYGSEHFEGAGGIDRTVPTGMGSGARGDYMGYGGGHSSGMR